MLHCEPHTLVAAKDCQEPMVHSGSVQVKHQAQRGHLEIESEKEMTTHHLHDVSTLVQKARHLYLPPSPEWNFFTPLATKP